MHQHRRQRSYPDPLTPQERKDSFLRSQQVKRETMTPAQVREGMRKAMHESLTAREGVTREDLLRANLPADQIDLHFRGVLLAVLEERKSGVYG